MIIHRQKTGYNDITVTRDGKIVTLWSPDGVRQTAIDERRPGVPSLEYAFNTGLALAFCKHPERALVLGLGGGAIPMMFRRLVPSMQVDVVEIDRDICDVATQYFGFSPDDALKLFVDDAADFVGHVESRYDIIVLDAYVGSEIPSALTSDGTFLKACNALADGGVFVANLWSSKRDHLNRVLGAIRRHFSDLRLLHGKRSQNVLAFAAAQPIDDEAVLRKAGEIQPHLPLRMPLAGLARQLR